MQCPIIVSDTFVTLQGCFYNHNPRWQSDSIETPFRLSIRFTVLQKPRSEIDRSGMHLMFSNQRNRLQMAQHLRFFFECYLMDSVDYTMAITGRSVLRQTWIDHRNLSVQSESSSMFASHPKADPTLIKVYSVILFAYGLMIALAAEMSPVTGRRFFTISFPIYEAGRV